MHAYRSSLWVIAAAIMLSAVAPAVAGDTYWQGTNGGAWSDSGNWSAGVPGADSNAIFNAKEMIVDLGGVTQGVHQVQLLQGGFELGNGTLGLQVLGVELPQIIQDSAGVNLISAQVQATLLVVDARQGTLTLSNTANSFGGQVNIAGGAQVTAVGGGSLGTSSVMMADGATLRLSPAEVGALAEVGVPLLRDPFNSSLTRDINAGIYKHIVSPGGGDDSEEFRYDESDNGKVMNPYGTGSYATTGPDEYRYWNTRFDLSGALSGNVTSNAQVVADSFGPGKLTYTADGYTYEEADGKGNYGKNGDNFNLGRGLALGDSDDTEAYWFSSMMYVHTNSENAHGQWMLNFTPDYNQIGQSVGFGFDNDSSDFDMELEINGSRVDMIAGAFTPGVTHLVVGKVDVDRAGAETVTYWLDPTDVTSEDALETAAYKLVHDTTDFVGAGDVLGQIRYVAYASDDGTYSQGQFFDELVIADSIEGLFGLDLAEGFSNDIEIVAGATGTVHVDGADATVDLQNLTMRAGAGILLDEGSARFAGTRIDGDATVGGVGSLTTGPVLDYSGGGALITKAGAGTLDISDLGNFFDLGTSLLVTGGTVVADSGSVTNVAFTLDGGALSLLSGTFDNPLTVLGSSLGLGDGVDYTGSVQIADGVTFDIGVEAGSATISGLITDTTPGAAIDNATISKSGAGTLVLTDLGNLMADTTTIDVQAGALTVVTSGAGSSIGSAAVNLANAGLTIAAGAPGDQTFGNAVTLGGSATLTAALGGVGVGGAKVIDVTSPLSVPADATLTLSGEDDHTLRLSGGVAGAGSIALEGGSVDLAAGSATHTGDTSVTAGSVTIGTPVTQTNTLLIDGGTTEMNADVTVVGTEVFAGGSVQLELQSDGSYDNDYGNPANANFRLDREAEETIKYSGDATHSGGQAALGEPADYYWFFWEGQFHPDADGDWTIRVSNSGNSGDIDDDGSIWIDKDGDGAWDSDEGVFTGGQSEATVTGLEAGKTYDFFIGFGENTGGTNFGAFVQGPTGSAIDAMTRINFASMSNLFGMAGPPAAVSGGVLNINATLNTPGLGVVGGTVNITGAGTVDTSEVLVTDGVLDIQAGATLTDLGNPGGGVVTQEGGTIELSQAIGQTTDDWTVVQSDGVTNLNVADGLGNVVGFETSGGVLDVKAANAYLEPVNVVAGGKLRLSAQQDTSAGAMIPAAPIAGTYAIATDIDGNYDGVRLDEGAQMLAAGGARSYESDLTLLGNVFLGDDISLLNQVTSGAGGFTVSAGTDPVLGAGIGDTGGENTYEGGTSIPMGTLTANKIGALGTGPVSVTGTGVLVLNLDGAAAFGPTPTPNPIDVRDGGVLNLAAEQTLGKLSATIGADGGLMGDSNAVGGANPFDGGAAAAIVLREDATLALTDGPSPTRAQLIAMGNPDRAILKLGITQADEGAGTGGIVVGDDGPGGTSLFKGVSFSPVYSSAASTFTGHLTDASVGGDGLTVTLINFELTINTDTTLATSNTDIGAMVDGAGSLTLDLTSGAGTFVQGTDLLTRRARPGSENSQGHLDIVGTVPTGKTVQIENLRLLLDSSTQFAGGLIVSSGASLDLDNGTPPSSGTVVIAGGSIDGNGVVTQPGILVADKRSDITNPAISFEDGAMVALCPDGGGSGNLEDFDFQNEGMPTNVIYVLCDGGDTEDGYEDLLLSNGGGVYARDTGDSRFDQSSGSTHVTFDPAGSAGDVAHFGSGATFHFEHVINLTIDSNGTPERDDDVIADMTFGLFQTVENKNDLNLDPANGAMQMENQGGLIVNDLTIYNGQFDIRNDSSNYYIGGILHVKQNGSVELDDRAKITEMLEKGEFGQGGIYLDNGGDGADGTRFEIRMDYGDTPGEPAGSGRVINQKFVFTGAGEGWRRFEIDEEGGSGTELYDFRDWTLQDGAVVGINRSNTSRDQVFFHVTLEGDATMFADNDDFHLSKVVSDGNDHTLTIGYTERGDVGSDNTVIDDNAVIGEGAGNVTVQVAVQNLYTMPGTNLAAGSNLGVLESGELFIRSVHDGGSPAGDPCSFGTTDSAIFTRDNRWVNLQVSENNSGEPPRFAYFNPWVTVLAEQTGALRADRYSDRGGNIRGTAYANVSLGPNSVLNTDEDNAVLVIQTLRLDNTAGPSAATLNVSNDDISLVDVIDLGDNTLRITGTNNVAVEGSVVAGGLAVEMTDTDSYVTFGDGTTLNVGSFTLDSNAPSGVRLQSGSTMTAAAATFNGGFLDVASDVPVTLGTANFNADTSLSAAPLTIENGIVDANANVTISGTVLGTKAWTTNDGLLTLVGSSAAGDGSLYLAGGGARLEVDGPNSLNTDVTAVGNATLALTGAGTDETLQLGSLTLENTGAMPTLGLSTENDYNVAFDSTLIDGDVTLAVTTAGTYADLGPVTFSGDDTFFINAETGSTVALGALTGGAGAVIDFGANPPQDGKLELTPSTDWQGTVYLRRGWLVVAEPLEGYPLIDVGGGIDVQATDPINLSGFRTDSLMLSASMEDSIAPRGPLVFDLVLNTPYVHPSMVQRNAANDGNQVFTIAGTGAVYSQVADAEFAPNMRIFFGDLDLPEVTLGRLGGGGEDFEISGVIEGNAGVLKVGWENVTLSGENTFEGDVFVDGGTLTMAHPRALGANGKFFGVLIGEYGSARLAVTAEGADLGHYYIEVFDGSALEIAANNVDFSSIDLTGEDLTLVMSGPMAGVTGSPDPLGPRSNTVINYPAIDASFTVGLLNTVTADSNAVVGKAADQGDTNFVIGADQTLTVAGDDIAVASPRIWNVNAGGTVRFEANVVGDADITKSGSGMLELTGAGNVINSLTVPDGSVLVTSSAPTTVVINDGTLYSVLAAGHNYDEVDGVNSTGVVALSADIGPGVTVDFSDNPGRLTLGARLDASFEGTLAAGPAGYFLGGGGAQLTMLSPLADSAPDANTPVTIGWDETTPPNNNPIPEGTVVLAADNTTTGDVNIYMPVMYDSDAVFDLVDGNAAGGNHWVYIRDGGVLDLNNTGSRQNNIKVVGGSLVNSGGTISAEAIQTIWETGDYIIGSFGTGTTTYADGGFVRAGANLIKIGTDTSVLEDPIGDSNNTYASNPRGSTIIQGGTLTVPQLDSLGGTATLRVETGGTATLAEGGTFDAVVEVAGTLNLPAGQVLSLTDGNSGLSLVGAGFWGDDTRFTGGGTIDLGSGGIIGDGLKILDGGTVIATVDAASGLRPFIVHDGGTARITWVGSINKRVGAIYPGGTVEFVSTSGANGNAQHSTSQEVFHLRVDADAWRANPATAVSSPGKPYRIVVSDAGDGFFGMVNPQQTTGEILTPEVDDGTGTIYHPVAYVEKSGPGGLYTGRTMINAGNDDGGKIHWLIKEGQLGILDVSESQNSLGATAGTWVYGYEFADVKDPAIAAKHLEGMEVFSGASLVWHGGHGFLPSSAWKTGDYAHEEGDGWNPGEFVLEDGASLLAGKIGGNTGRVVSQPLTLGIQDGEDIYLAYPSIRSISPSTPTVTFGGAGTLDLRGGVDANTLNATGNTYKAVVSGGRVQFTGDLTGAQPVDNFETLTVTGGTAVIYNSHGVVQNTTVSAGTLAFAPDGAGPSISYTGAIHNEGRIHAESGTTDLSDTVITGTTVTAYNPPTDGLLLHYAFEDGAAATMAADSSGNGRDGLIRGATYVDDGRIGGAMSFGGDGDDIYDDDAGTYMNGLTALTASVWIKSNAYDVDNGFLIFETPDDGDSKDWRYDEAGANAGGDAVIKGGVETEQGVQAVESAERVQTTEWQHVLVTWSAGEDMKYYIDGSADIPTSVQAAVGGALTGYDIMLVGKGGKDQGAVSWNGLIDEVRIYDRVLGEAEISSLYAAGGALGSIQVDSGASLLTKGFNDMARVTVDGALTLGDHASDCEQLTLNSGGVLDLGTSALDVGSGWIEGTLLASGANVQQKFGAFTMAGAPTINLGSTPGSMILTETASIDTDYTFDSNSKLKANGAMEINGEVRVPAGATIGAGQAVINGSLILNGGDAEFNSIAVQEGGVMRLAADESQQLGPVHNDGTIHVQSGVTDMSDTVITSIENDAEVQWVGEDIGADPDGGSHAEADGVFTIQGGGADIWGTADEFYYVHAPLPAGPAAFTVRVVSVTNTNGWTKAGIHIRNSLAPDAAMGMVAVTPGNGTDRQRRLNDGDGADSPGDPTGGATAPQWIRMEWDGVNTMTGFTAEDEGGMPGAWQVLGGGPVQINLTDPGDNVMGLALTSHSDGTLATAVIDNLSGFRRDYGFLQIDNGATLRVGGFTNAADITLSGTLELGPHASDCENVFLDGNGLLDLDGSGSLLIKKGDIDAVTASLAAAFQAGWDVTTGITSTDLIGQANRAIGTYNDANDEVLIMPTVVGDADLDGDFDNADMQVLTDNFNSAGTWQNADTNYDSQVDHLDYLTMKWYLVPSAGTEDAVPEPATLVLLALGAYPILLRRRRRA